MKRIPILVTLSAAVSVGALPGTAHAQDAAQAAHIQALRQEVLQNDDRIRALAEKLKEFVPSP